MQVRLPPRPTFSTAHRPIQRLAQELGYAVANKPIATICHGAQLLAAAGVLEGRSCAAYPAVGPDVTRAGGHYADIGMDQAHVEGNLVTAPARPAHPAWLSAFLKLLSTRIEL